MHFPSPHTGGTGLSERLWFEKYWQPINSLGYRDIEPREASTFKDGLDILFLGDSFTSGHGVAFNEVSSSILRETVQEKALRWNIYNAGMNGADTRAEIKALDTFTLKPDVVVLQYFGNDIEGAAQSHGYVMEPPQLYGDLPGWGQYIVKNSYLLDYFYWAIPRQGWSHQYFDYFRKAYKDPAVLKTHLEDLEQLIKTTETGEAHLVVIVHPFLAVPFSIDYSEKILNFFDSKGITTLDVRDLVKSWSWREKVVGANDSHPSAKLHRKIAHEVHRIIQRQVTGRYSNINGYDQ